MNHSNTKTLFANVYSSDVMFSDYLNVITIKLNFHVHLHRTSNVLCYTTYFYATKFVNVIKMWKFSIYVKGYSLYEYMCELFALTCRISVKWMEACSMPKRRTKPDSSCGSKWKDIQYTSYVVAWQKDCVFDSAYSLAGSCCLLSESFATV